MLGPAAAASAAAATGAGCGSRWTRARRGPCAWRSTRLYRDGLAYRTEALDQLVPGLSDERQRPRGHPDARRPGTLWTIRYHLIDEATGQPDPDATIAVATTRPETILGDTAVAVHPDDARYAALVGRRVRIPFVERDVPDHRGRGRRAGVRDGAVKITPAHDHDDYETGSATACR